MANAIIELSVAARLAARSLGRRLRGGLDPIPDASAFESSMEAALASLAPGVVQAHHWLTLRATEPPWRDTGVAMKPGAHVSYFAVGRVYASRLLDIWVAPKNQIWARIGDGGDVISSSRDSNSVVAAEGAPLFLGNYFPNDWSDVQGARLQDDDVYRSVSGETRICIVEWNTTAMEGVAALVGAGDPWGLASQELERLGGVGRPPDDWHYLWSVGEAEIFRGTHGGDGQASIDCHVEGDVGILQKEVDCPLTPDTEISWSWVVESLPGLVREDTLPSHDYLSIAVEFDNGWDITYYWSTALPIGTGYVCPLPNWKHREYHVVVRSGPEDLGRACHERRNLSRDIQQYMQAYMDAPPQRVVRVWLIANSIFRRQPGRCSFSNIRLVDGGREVVVL